MDEEAAKAQTFVTVAEFSTVEEAEMARGIVDAEGIECALRDANISTAHPFLIGAVGWVKLDVVASEAPRARELLAAVASPVPTDKETVRLVLKSCIVGYLFAAAFIGGVAFVSVLSRTGDAVLAAGVYAGVIAGATAMGSLHRVYRCSSASCGARNRPGAGTCRSCGRPIVGVGRPRGE